MNFILFLAVYLSLLIVIEKKFAIGKKFFRNNRRIKTVIVALSFIVIIGVQGTSIGSYLGSYVYIVMRAISSYLFTIAMFENLEYKRI